MDRSIDDRLYERLDAPALEHAWLVFYRERAAFRATGRPWLIENQMLRARNRLVLHYAPIVKFTVSRKMRERRAEIPSTMFAAAMIAVIGGMMDRRDDALTDWTPTCVRLAADACDTFEKI